MAATEFIIAAVKDELTETYLQPVFGEDQQDLIRTFTFQINNIPLWKDNATDYSFYKLGYFNSITGEIKPEIEKLISGHTVVRKE